MQYTYKPSTEAAIASCSAFQDFLHLKDTHLNEVGKQGTAEFLFQYLPVSKAAMATGYQGREEDCSQAWVTEVLEGQ